MQTQSEQLSDSDGGERRGRGRRGEFCRRCEGVTKLIFWLLIINDSPDKMKSQLSDLVPGFYSENADGAWYCL